MLNLKKIVNIFTNCLFSGFYSFDSLKSIIILHCDFGATFYCYMLSMLLVNCFSCFISGV